MRPLILISNDDGYEAKGINCLIEMVRDYGDVLVCAPEGARSGMACAFTATQPLTLTLRRKEVGDCKSPTTACKCPATVEVWSCNGTPVDCVKMALAELCDRKPDLVIGGINHGDNASVNTHYSGTMGVTMEGCMKYINSVAFSLCDHRADADFSPLEPYVREVVQQVLRDGLPKGVCLNINFPLLPSFKGVKVCRMAPGTWANEVAKCHHPRGYDYWWMMGHYQNDEPEAEDTDNWALTHGYVAITPTRMDVTAYEAIDQIRQWHLSCHV
ncbi:MAG: 5'/3'-nucleotidase SurE [Prevotella sp.]|nr:5'/3'-nucleotidase SurE [Prevotella sp.]